MDVTMTLFFGPALMWHVPGPVSARGVRLSISTIRHSIDPQPPTQHPPTLYDGAVSASLFFLLSKMADHRLRLNHWFISSVPPFLRPHVHSSDAAQCRHQWYASAQSTYRLQRWGGAGSAVVGGSNDVARIVNHCLSRSFLFLLFVWVCPHTDSIMKANIQPHGTANNQKRLTDPASTSLSLISFCFCSQFLSFLNNRVTIWDGRFKYTTQVRLSTPCSSPPKQVSNVSGWGLQWEQAK
jgi:hypothetical protein